VIPSGITGRSAALSCPVARSIAPLRIRVRTLLRSRGWSRKRPAKTKSSGWLQRPVELDDKVILRRLAENDAQALVVGAFQQAIRALSMTEREPTIEESALRVSETPPFPWSRETVDGEHTVFNLTPVDSSLEARFARWLDRAGDVTAWAKLTMNSRFAREYISKAGALRYYYPDFVLRLSDDSCLIIETKGQEDLDVAMKDRRARRWCVDATRLAGRAWAYEKVPQKLFGVFAGDTVEGLRRFLAASGVSGE